MDSVAFGRVYVIVELPCTHVNATHLMLSMRSILSRVDCMLYSSLGKVPALNPYGCVGFDITDEFRKDRSITIEIGYAGFDRNLLLVEFERVVSSLIIHITH